MGPEPRYLTNKEGLATKVRNRVTDGEWTGNTTDRKEREEEWYPVSVSQNFVFQNFAHNRKPFGSTPITGSGLGVVGHKGREQELV